MFNETLILENERVLLRPLQFEDFDLLLPFALKEPEIWTYSLTPAHSEKDLQFYMKMALAKRKQGDTYPFIIFDKQSNEYAGSTRYYDFQEYHKATSIGYTWYGKKFQGTGLNKNCKYLLLSYAFEQLHLERVEFRADMNNARSIAAMKSIGCQKEGILRNNCSTLNGKRRSSIVLSIIKEDWFNGTKEKLQEKIEVV